MNPNETTTEVKNKQKEYPCPNVPFIVRSSVLQISGFEFDAAICVSTDWEDYMGGNWKRLRTKDLVGTEHILEMDFDAKTLSVILPSLRKNCLRKKYPTI